MTRAASRLYFDTFCIAKFYFNEPESIRVREAVRKADVIYSCLGAFVGFHAMLHRRLCRGRRFAGDARELDLRFSRHLEDGRAMAAAAGQRAHVAGSLESLSQDCGCDSSGHGVRSRGTGRVDP